MKTIIPAEALAQHTAILGKTGSGKTSTAKLAIEQVYAEGARVCVLDPIKSDWWGLTSSADGKKPGLAFDILGGPRGHVALHSSAGKAIGELVATGALPHSIIDMADFEPGGQARFFVDFAPTLLRRMRGVLYLAIEESHLFAPKERSGIGAESMAIHWAKTLATAGRSKGNYIHDSLPHVRSNRQAGSVVGAALALLLALALIVAVLGGQIRRDGVGTFLRQVVGEGSPVRFTKNVLVRHSPEVDAPDVLASISNLNAPHIVRVVGSSEDVLKFIRLSQIVLTPGSKFIAIQERPHFLAKRECNERAETPLDLGAVSSRLSEVDNCHPIRPMKHFRGGHALVHPFAFLSSTQVLGNAAKWPSDEIGALRFLGVLIGAAHGEPSDDHQRKREVHQREIGDLYIFAQPFGIVLMLLGLCSFLSEKVQSSSALYFLAINCVLGGTSVALYGPEPLLWVARLLLISKWTG